MYRIQDPTNNLFAFFSSKRIGSGACVTTTTRSSDIESRAQQLLSIRIGHRNVLETASVGNWKPLKGCVLGSSARVQQTRARVALEVDRKQFGDKFQAGRQNCQALDMRAPSILG